MVANCKHAITIVKIGDVIRLPLIMPKDFVEEVRNRFLLLIRNFAILQSKSLCYLENVPITTFNNR
jgi:hypothetical protein